MAKILLINPSRWGRGITPIWIASHSAILKSKGHCVKLFDGTFYADWSVDEVGYNTENKQYKVSDYPKYINYHPEPILTSLQKVIDEYAPDIVFWSALSSHIHGEGEYVNIQYGDELVNQVKTNAFRVAAGLQPMADPKRVLIDYPAIDALILGESEKVLTEVAGSISDREKMLTLAGLAFRCGDEIHINPRAGLIRDLDDIPAYDYSVFEDQVFYRAYNGEVVRALDYELSRGCVYSCSYCVETLIQRFYGFIKTNRNGVIVNAGAYVRHKSAERIYQEINSYNNLYGITLLRCQDTNFLTINRKTLYELADRLERQTIPVKLYIETRPEGINEKTVLLLKRLQVDGVGMGVEVASEKFRHSSLKRFTTRPSIIRAFDLLKKHQIKRTSYNIIGLPGEDEEMIKETIIFNKQLAPDNITVAFYSPYLGTEQQRVGKEQKYFDDYAFHVDGQLRTVARTAKVDTKTLEFYKKYFVILCREGLANLEMYKKEFFHAT